MTSLYSRPIRAEINLNALRNNLKVAKRLAARHSPDVKLMAVIKANAYGHGMERISQAIQGEADEFCVASVEDAAQLRELGLELPMTALSSVLTQESVDYAVANSVAVVIYDEVQLNDLESLTKSQNGSLDVWLKFNTGMNRLGFKTSDAERVVAAILNLPNVALRGIMSHLSDSDEPSNSKNQEQLTSFVSVCENVSGFVDESVNKEFDKSLSNSGAIVGIPEAAFDCVRPGIMLYGCSPVNELSAEQIGLAPVMTLKSKLISVAQLNKGDAVGYGSTWQAPETMSYGIVACGYGDGYPRSAAKDDRSDGKNAHVLIRGIKVLVIGRVSMDMIAVDLREVEAQIGDDVTLWGEGLPVEEVAQIAGTISYELLCGVTSRVKKVYIDDASS